MEQTWRWFGENDPISLNHVKQAGATGVVTALHHLPVGTTWHSDEIAKRKAFIEAAGLTWSVCESIPMEDSVKRGDAGARRAIDTWKDTLANLGRAGVPVVCYNFMPVVDWTRTDLNYLLPTTGYALRFDMIDFIVYDAFVLKRRDAISSYTPDLVAAAEKRLATKSENELLLLEKNIIAGLPGGADAQTRASISALISSFDGVSADAMRANLVAFLKEVVPVAEEFGVRLGVHPDDPPFSLFGLPRVVSTADDARAILAAVTSEANGLTFCTGSYGARKDNDLVAMAQEFAPRVNFAHLRNVAVEPDGSFHEAEHLDGQADMVAIIEILLREQRVAKTEGRRSSIPLRPDHGHLLADDITKKSNPGYSYAGRLKGLGELRGVMRALSRYLDTEGSQA
ncbi:mannonate dehydratase [Agrobacterium rhizogenes]|nr:mannonate dehydratase [Rhizobium rhizogenes]NTJ79410.1 mannonate dehydratase [Rhizobium rhizogenes]